MSQRPHVPSMVLSSRAGRWLSLATLADVAHDAGTQGLDLDLAGRSLSFAGLSRGPHIGPGVAGHVESVWLPLRRAPLLAGGRVDHLLNDWIGLTRDVGARQVVIDRAAAMRPLGNQDKRPLLIRLQDALGSSARVTVVLRPAELEGTRAHLATLGALRRTAEEWDFDLGIDLVGGIDPRWEAEAALQRLHSRLSLVRLQSVGADASSADRCRLTGRSLAYLLDQSFPGTLSLVPRVPWSGALSRTVLERRTRDAALSVIERHQRIFSPSVTTTRLPSKQER